MMVLIRLTMLICIITLSSCDQYATIGVVDTRLYSDGSSTESPEGYSDASVDVHLNASCDDRPVVAGDCDPTKDDGRCPASMTMKCVANFQEANPTGYCAFYTPMPGSMCLYTGLTDSCLPSYYCYNGTCRKLCLCNDECSTGECCSEPIGGGFNLCTEC